MGLANLAGRQSWVGGSWERAELREVFHPGNDVSPIPTKNYLYRLCDLTSTALQQTLSHKKKPMLVPAPFIHPVIGRSSSSSVMFHAWFILLLICNGLKGSEEYCSIRIFQCLYFLQRLLFSSGRKVLLALMCEAERWDLQHLAVQETPTVMVRLCLWRVHLLLHLSLKGDHPSVSVTLASYSLISAL